MIAVQRKKGAGVATSFNSPFFRSSLCVDLDFLDAKNEPTRLMNHFSGQFRWRHELNNVAVSTPLSPLSKHHQNISSGCLQVVQLVSEKMRTAIRRFAVNSESEK